ncbi:MAG TPA: hypothetical protein VJ301_10190 [Propionibacteriaceae bacterium]|nr:hypothetical protein [Propionibacteriaceae bacterium]
MSADLDPTGHSRVLAASGTATAAEPEDGTSDLSLSRPGLARFAAGLYRQTLVEPVEHGRMRDLDWPYGLRSIVLAGYVVFVIAGLMVIFSGLIREHSTLIIFGSGLGLPEQMVWPLVLLLSFGVASLMAAAQHGPWWLKVLGLLFTLMVMGTWSLRSPSLAGWAGWPVIAASLMVAMLLLVIIRWRRRFAWWEFAVIWALVGLGMTIGVAETREAKVYGSDLNPLNLQQTAAVLGYLALPAATFAGAAVAEVTVRATVAATQNAQRFAKQGWPYLILIVVLCVRLIQCIWLIAERDPVVEGLTALLWASTLVAAFAVVGLIMLRLSRRQQAVPVVSGLGDELGRVGFTIAAALIAVTLPVQVFLSVLQVLASLEPGGAAARLSFDITPLLTRIVDPSRVLVGVVLIMLAVRAARRGRSGRALVLGCIGVMLVALARQLLFGDRTPAPINPDALNLVASAVVMVAVVILLVRRSLTPQRALAFSGVLILSALFSYRDFISDPLGAVLGFSGVALVLFGLTWDLFTGSGWANAESRRFSRPTRVLLVLTNYVLSMTVLAYAALIRDGSTTIYFDPFAQLGDLIFGTGLLAAATVAVFECAWRDRPIS